MNLRLGLAPNKFTLISGIICQIWRRDTDKYTQHTERKNLGDKLLKLEKHDKCRCFHNSCFCGYKAKLTNNISITTIITNRFCRLKYATIEGDGPLYLFIFTSTILSSSSFFYLHNTCLKMYEGLCWTENREWCRPCRSLLFWTEPHNNLQGWCWKHNITKKRRRKLLAFKKIFFFFLMCIVHTFWQGC